MFYTYIIESETTGRWYYGHSDSLERRMEEHNTRGKTRYTSGKGPWKILWTKEFPTRGEAVDCENKLKRIKNKTYIKKLLQLES